MFAFVVYVSPCAPSLFPGEPVKKASMSRGSVGGQVAKDAKGATAAQRKATDSDIDKQEKTLLAKGPDEE